MVIFVRLIGPTLIIVAALLFIVVIHPVDATTFEMTSFETDKLVYEVGETIHMAAHLTADFEDPGYCHVGFYVTTAQGPVYSDAYYIDSSPDPRTLYSSYVIIPEDVAPGTNGTHATTQFNYDFYDERYSDAGTLTVVVDIKRGHLEVTPLTELRSEVGQNISLAFKITSIYSSSIVLANESVSVRIANETISLYESNVTTDLAGVLNVNWSDNNLVPATYNITIYGIGNEDFLPFSQSFDLIVDPAPSFLQAIQNPDLIHCQSTDGHLVESAFFEFVHQTKTGTPILGGKMFWNSSFSNGELASLGNGRYKGNISFPIPPGAYTINFTAVHSSYYTAFFLANVTVIPRPVSAVLINDTLPLSGTNCSLSVHVLDNLTGTDVALLHLSISLEIDNYTSWIQGDTNQTGWFTGYIFLPYDKWGISRLTVDINSSVYYEDTSTISNLVIYFKPVLMVNTSKLVVGVPTGISCSLYDPKGNPLSGVRIDLGYFNGTNLVNNMTNNEGAALLEWTLSDMPSGSQIALRFTVKGGIYQYQDSLMKPFNFSILIPLYLNSLSYPLSCLRNSSIDVNMTIGSPWIDGDSTLLRIADYTGQINQSQSIVIGAPFYFSLLYSSSATLGTHIIHIISLNESLIPYDHFSFEIAVYDSLEAEFSSLSAFYAEGVELDLEVRESYGGPVDKINVSFWIDDMTDYTSLVSVNISDTLQIPFDLDVSPGFHVAHLEIDGVWYVSSNYTFTIFVWVRTTLNLDVITIISGNDTNPHTQDNAPTSSSGSIIRPPPTLFNETTSVDLDAARSVSLESCPKLSSGTSNRSTVLENSRTASSGNGQIVLNRNERNRFGCFAITSSTVLEVLPKDTIPHSAVSGPVMITSVNISLAAVIFSSRRRTSLS